MNRAARLAKIEAAQKPCRWCEILDLVEKEYRSALLSQGITLHIPKPEDITEDRCQTCGTRWLYDLTFISVEDRKIDAWLDKQSRVATANGESEMPREWWTAWLGVVDRCDAAKRAFYGEAYDVAIRQTKFPIIRDWIAEKAKTSVGHSGPTGGKL